MSIIICPVCGRRCGGYHSFRCHVWAMRLKEGDRHIDLNLKEHETEEQ